MERHKRGCTGNSNLGAGYTDEECIFLRAIDEYKIKHHLVDLTPRQILEVAYSLGYRKVD